MRDEIFLNNDDINRTFEIMEGYYPDLCGLYQKYAEKFEQGMSAKACHVVWMHFDRRV